MLYLYVNRSVGVIEFLSFAFILCLFYAIHWPTAKKEYADWKRLRLLKKVNKPTKKGLHK